MLEKCFTFYISIFTRLFLKILNFYPRAHSKEKILPKTDKIYIIFQGVLMSVTFKGSPVAIGGKELKVGDKATEVEVVGANLASIKIGAKSDKAQIVLTLPSLDTAVCANEARAFNVKASKLPNVSVVIVSMDLPFAMGRFCTTEGIENLKVGSDFRDKAFAKEYGVLIKEGVLSGLLTRAAFIIDKNGVIAYKQIVPEITNEPLYDEIITAAEALG
jgi:thiol peroxidase